MQTDTATDVRDLVASLGEHMPSMDGMIAPSEFHEVTSSSLSEISVRMTDLVCVMMLTHPSVSRDPEASVDQLIRANRCPQ